MIILEIFIKSIPWLWLFQKKRKSFHSFYYFYIISFHDFHDSWKIKIIPSLSLFLHYFPSVIFMIRKNENHSIILITFTSFSFHDFHDYWKIKIIP